MVKTIPVIYRSGVFVPMTAIHEIAIDLPVDGVAEAADETEYSLAQNLALLYQTAGLLDSNLPADEVRYIVESVQLAEENIALAVA
jgi:hypothetical protein